MIPIASAFVTTTVAAMDDVSRKRRRMAPTEAAVAVADPSRAVVDSEDDDALTDYEAVRESQGRFGVADVGGDGSSKKAKKDAPSKAKKLVGSSTTSSSSSSLLPPTLDKTGKKGLEKAQKKKIAGDSTAAPKKSKPKKPKVGESRAGGDGGVHGAGGAFRVHYDSVFYR